MTDKGAVDRCLQLEFAVLVPVLRLIEGDPGSRFDAFVRSVLVVQTLLQQASLLLFVRTRPAAAHVGDDHRLEHGEPHIMKCVVDRPKNERRVAFASVRRARSF